MFFIFPVLDCLAILPIKAGDFNVKKTKKILKIPFIIGERSTTVLLSVVWG